MPNVKDIREPENRRAVRFGAFEYSASTGELRRRGHKIRLIGQPVHLLNLLVERPGAVVTRDEMRSRLWTEDTFVDFEHSLNAAIKRLRRALGDSAAKPRFIETMARQGYRFIAQVEPVTELPGSPEHPVYQQQVAPLPLPPWQFSRLLFPVLILAIIVTGWIGLAAFTNRRLRSDPVLFSSKLTLLAAGEGDLSDPAISWDGKMLAYVKGQGLNQRIYVRRVAESHPIRLSHAEGREMQPAFAPNDERIAFTRYPEGSARPQICIAPVLGGELACILDGGRDPSWSPDGSRLAFVLEKEDRVQVLATAKSDGTGTHVIFTADAIYPLLRHPSWSANGRSIAFERSMGRFDGEIWLIPAEGGAASRMSRTVPGVFMRHPTFTPDGQGIIYSSNQAGATDLWYHSFGRYQSSVHLTEGPSPEEWPSVSRTRRVVFSSNESRDALFVADLHTGATSRLLNHYPHIWAPSISPDDRQITFSQVDYSGMWRIWTVPVGGGDSRPLTSDEAPQIYSRFSRDGQWITYFTWVPGSSRIWRVPRYGGAAQPLTPVGEDAGFGDVSPDGRTLAFAKTENGTTHIYVKPMRAGTERQLVRISSTLPRWSPGGDWIAFSGDRGLTGGVFITRPDGTGLRRLASSGGWPVWLPDGKRIAFLRIGSDGTQHIEAVTTGGEAAALPGIRFSDGNGPVDFSADGKLTVYSVGETLSSEIWLMDLHSENRGPRRSLLTRLLH